MGFGMGFGIWDGIWDWDGNGIWDLGWRSEEHTSELQSRSDLVCRLLLEKKKKKHANSIGLGSKNITLHATAVIYLRASQQFRHYTYSKKRRKTASNSSKQK